MATPVKIIPTLHGEAARAFPELREYYKPYLRIVVSHSGISSVYCLNPNRSLELHSYKMSVKHANLCHCVIDPRLFSRFLFGGFVRNHYLWSGFYIKLRGIGVILQYKISTIS